MSKEKMIEEQGICIFPAMGYWKMYGKPVGSRLAISGLHPDAKWVSISHSKCCLTERQPVLQ